MRLSIREKIKNALQDVLKDLGLETTDFVIEHPNQIAHGDYATNVAMVCGSDNPRDLAQEIVSKLVVKNIPEIDRVQIAGPGFINFFLSREFFRVSLENITKVGDMFGACEIYAGKRVLVEHSSPNLFKPLHIGHLVNNTIGESLSRLFRHSGARVTTMSYPSDVSLGIAKAIWGVMEEGEEALNQGDLSEQIKFLGSCYVLGTEKYEASEDVQKAVRQINEEIYFGSAGRALDIYKKGRALTLTYFENITQKLGSHFDGYVFESEAGVVGLAIVKEFFGKVFEESDGAIIYDGERVGLHKRVFVNSRGLPVYEAKDLGLIKIKFQRYKPDLSVFVTGLEQEEYFHVVLAAAGEINPEWAKKSKHIPHGFLRLADGKMSSRAGRVILAEDLISLTKHRVEEKRTESNTSKEIDEKATDKIAIAAIKFSILKSAPSKNIIFDIDKSISFDGDSGPYLQYTYARIQALLQKAREHKRKPNIDRNSDEVFAIEKLVYRFPEMVEKALQNYEPHHIANELLLVAREFNTFYESEKIIETKIDPNSPNPVPQDLGAKKRAEHKLAIARAVGIVIQNGLHLLGIETVAQM